MARNDFLTGFLQGLYQSGVGNPEVQESRRQNQLQEQYTKMAMGKTAADAGMMPAPTQDTSQHPVWDKVKSVFGSILGGGGQAPTQYVKDPNAVSYALGTQGDVIKASGDLPEGYTKVPDRKQGATMFEAYTKNQQKVLTAEQYDAIRSGDGKKISDAFGGKIPMDVLTKQSQQDIASSRKSIAQTMRDRLEFSKRQAVVGGKMGAVQQSYNTALLHASTVADAFDAIQNTNQEWLNVPINKIREKTNNPQIIALGNALNALRGEAANVFKGSGATDTEISSWKDYLNENLTPSQAVAAVQTLSDLMQSRSEALRYQQKQVSPDTPLNPVLSPGAESARKRISTLGGGKNEVERKTSDGITAIFDATTKQFLRYK